MPDNLHPTNEELLALPPRERGALVAAVRELRKRQDYKFNKYFPDAGPFRRELYPKHMQFFRAGATFKERLLMAANRVGKALRHGTRVATLDGWKPIEDIRVGDTVFAGDGTPTVVRGVYPQGEREMLRFTFDCGETIDCDHDHRWKYQHPRGRYPYRRSHKRDEPNPFYGEWVVGRAVDILKRVGHAPITRRRAVIPTSKPWQFPTRDVPISPYVLGVLLGDGCLTQGVRFTSADVELVERVRAELPPDVVITTGRPYAYGIVAPNHRIGDEPNSVLRSIRDLGLFKTVSDTKFVPEEYLYNSEDVRLDVLRGLMDTDGSIGRTGGMEFSTCSTRLADDVTFLVHSLGGKVRRENRQTHCTYLGKRVAGAPSVRLKIRLNICPFYLPRKAERWNTRKNTPDRIIHRIDYAPSGLATCLEVEHPSHTFVIEHGIVTHNSEAGAYEVRCHATGLYPDWWEGKRFDEPVEIWACGTNSETTRDIVQAKLFGAVDPMSGGTVGNGMIETHLVLATVRRPHGLVGSIESAWVQHVSGGKSMIGLKMYEQGRSSFEGTAKHVVWCIAEGELVQMVDGTMRPIEDIRVGDMVLSLDTNGRPVPRRVLKVHDQGEKPCVEVSPKHGTPVICTADHDLYWGYNRISKAPAASAERIAQPRPGSFWPALTYDYDDAWYVWAALVVAEGSITNRKITNGDEASMQKAIALLPPSARVRKKTFANGHVPDWHLYWSEFWSEIPPGKSADKSVPEWVFTSHPDQARLFLRWLFMGDGWATGHAVCYATTSRVLAQQVVVLLNRLGVRASIAVREHTRWARQYWVRITRSGDVLHFLETIGIEGKDVACAAVAEEAHRRVASKRARAEHFVRHGRRDMQSRNDDARLKSSRVKSIADVGARRVYDITVENEHRFLCGTSLVSNCDEEPPEDVYTEMLYRTATTKGITLITFTPLQGMSSVVTGFLNPSADAASVKVMINAGWDDVPHLDAEQKASLLATTPPFQREARSKGIPQLGSGAIYAIAESMLKVQPFAIPENWPRWFGLDAGGGAKPTGIVWFAEDPSTKTVYVTDVYKRESPELALHVEAIRARGIWMPGVGDAAALVLTHHDAEQLVQSYRSLGVDLILPDKSVETGILDVWLLMTSGTFKVFSSCEPWWEEFRLYHRDEKGRIVKKNDHLMDATRYGVRSGRVRGKVKPPDEGPLKVRLPMPAIGTSETSWMAG